MERGGSRYLLCLYVDLKGSMFTWCIRGRYIYNWEDGLGLGKWLVYVAGFSRDGLGEGSEGSFRFTKLLGRGHCGWLPRVCDGLTDVGWGAD